MRSHEYPPPPPPGSQYLQQPAPVQTYELLTGEVQIVCEAYWSEQRHRIHPGESAVSPKYLYAEAGAPMLTAPCFLGGAAFEETRAVVGVLTEVQQGYNTLYDSQ